MGVRVEAIEGWDGESRTCTIICDGRCNTQPTVINEESSEVEPQAIEAMESRIDELLPKASVVLVTGSLSRGLSEDFCASVIRRASARQIVTAIDAIV